MWHQLLSRLQLGIRTRIFSTYKKMKSKILLTWCHGYFAKTGSRASSALWNDCSEWKRFLASSESSFDGTRKCLWGFLEISEHYSNYSSCFAWSKCRCATILESGSDVCRASFDFDSCLSTDSLNGNLVGSAAKGSVVVNSSWLAQLLSCLISADSLAIKRLSLHLHLKQFASPCSMQFQAQYQAARNEFLSQGAKGCVTSRWSLHGVWARDHCFVLC